MFWKMVLIASGILVVLWATGFDFPAAMDAVVGIAQSNAEMVTGSEYRDEG